MVDSIDLDEIETDDADEPDGNYGDWLWRGEGNPDDEPEPAWEPTTATTETGPAEPDPQADESSTDTHHSDESDDGDESSTNTDRNRSVDTAAGATEHDSDASATNDEPNRQPIPGVPRTSKGPVGVPESGGGVGAGTAANSASNTSGTDSATAVDDDSSQRTTNHGDEPTPDEMTMAITYEAINRLADPRFAIADARSWTDWIGIVGTVSTPAIRKFQRDTGIELDFFGGSETGPAQRLADITPDSMFYADRMVLVGVADNEAIADAADWEFVPLEKAADKAGWEIEHAE